MRITSATNTEDTPISSGKISPQKQAIPAKKTGQQIITRTKMDDKIKKIIERIAQQIIERVTGEITKKLEGLQLKS
jgi:uncharacterized protein YbcI